MFYKIDTVYITLVNVWYEILKVTGYLSSEALVQICSIQKGGRWNLGRVPQLVHRFHWNRRVRFSTVCTRLNSVTHTHCETSRNPRFKLQHLAVVMIRKMMSPPKKKVDQSWPSSSQMTDRRLSTVETIVPSMEINYISENCDFAKPLTIFVSLFNPETYLSNCQTPMMKILAKIVNG